MYTGYETAYNPYDPDFRHRVDFPIERRQPIGYNECWFFLFTGDDQRMFNLYTGYSGHNDTMVFNPLVLGEREKITLCGPRDCKQQSADSSCLHPISALINPDIFSAQLGQRSLDLF